MDSKRQFLDQISSDLLNKTRQNKKSLMDIKLYFRQGTSFDVRLILINGRKSVPSGAAPVSDKTRDKVVDSFEELFDRVMNVTEPRNRRIMTKSELEKQAIALEKMLIDQSFGNTEDDDDYTDHEKLFIRYKELKNVYANEVVLFETPGTLVAFNEDAITLFASELANCWSNGDYEEHQMVQNILSPEGIIYDKENDTYRTSSVNKVIELIAELSATYTQKKERQVNLNDNLSPSVAPTGIPARTTSI